MNPKREEGDYKDGEGGGLAKGLVYVSLALYIADKLNEVVSHAGPFCVSTSISFKFLI
jgi:hypothetical protein